MCVCVCQRGAKDSKLHSQMSCVISSQLAESFTAINNVQQPAVHVSGTPLTQPACARVLLPRTSTGPPMHMRQSHYNSTCSIYSFSKSTCMDKYRTYCSISITMSHFGFPISPYTCRMCILHQFISIDLLGYYRTPCSY